MNLCDQYGIVVINECPAIALHNKSETLQTHVHVMHGQAHLHACMHTHAHTHTLTTPAQIHLFTHIQHRN